jgi:tRNA(adenine34) deaminase
MKLSDFDISCFDHAIQLSRSAEREGNLPIGAVIGLDGIVVAEGQNSIWFPTFNPNRHAEIEALRNVPDHLWKSSRSMTLYTTLEPCLMCLGAILLHHVGRVIYGSSDYYGGADKVKGYMPEYFEDEASRVEWIGPVYAGECDPLFARVMELVKRRRDRSPN